MADRAVCRVRAVLPCCPAALQHFTHTKGGLGMSAYDLSNNTGASLNVCLEARAA